MRQILKDFADGAAVAFAVIAAILLLFVAPLLLIILWAVSTIPGAWSFAVGLALVMTYFGGLSWAFACFAERKGWRPLGLVSMPPPPPPPPPPLPRKD